jgi:UDPglucose 6-dehydrogenase
MKVAIIGTGHVGLTTAACFASVGHEVVGVDSDREKLDRIIRGDVPFFEPGLTELTCAQVDSGRLTFTHSIAEATQQAEALFICVGTPARATGEANLVYVEAVAREIASSLPGYRLVAEKSTVPVETGEWVRMTMQRHNRSGAEFDVASNPEFLREGNAIHDTLEPDRIVAGVSSERAANVLREVYEPIIKETGCPFLITDIRTAELIKHASNAFLATKISFANALAAVCERAGADVELVTEAMGADLRIGRAFLHAGAGYGGACFPKDVDAFIHRSKELGYRFGLLEEVAKINEQTRASVVAKVRRVLWNLEHKKIAVLGLAFKPDTDDVRNAPSLDVCQRLIKGGAEVRAWDPQAIEEAKAVAPEISYCADAEEALRGADCAVLMTEWDEFRRFTPAKLKSLLAHPIVVDARNFYDPAEMAAAGFTYISVGRPIVGEVPSRK